MIMPQEMDVWYLLPALRRELSRILVVEESVKQKDIARILGITTAAVSQYLSGKRGTDLTFTPPEITVIHSFAKKMLENPSLVMQYMVELSIELKKSGSLCALHKSLDSSISESCTICKQRK